jgi:cytochrome c-type biogenesis protein CcmF
LKTEFLNEITSYGKLGHLLALLALVASLTSLISYGRAAVSKNLEDTPRWQALGRSAFIMHAVGVLGVFIVLFFIIFNHRYEYNYVYNHSSNALPFKYLLSCFWEGQEGSFLLWMIWHVVLGLITAFTAGIWENKVMTVISAVQFILSITIVGIYIADIKIGSSPFALLRNEMVGAPIFQQANYLDFIKDGKGLNPLLQNYWMVIHPPVLFLGFAATLIPFAYTIAAMWQGNFNNWVKPTLGWTLFGAAVLGTGICMGGAWAYESLSFGGYWAWDPVENASLVPWLTLVGAAHTLNIYKSSQYSLKTTLILLLASFFLVIYSTYLTRTGILGDTSVHAFTGEGASLTIHLISFLGLIAIISIGLYIKAARSIAAPTAEEGSITREFWMYIGSLILLISAIQITFTTSIPVWNKLFGLKLAPPADPMSHYNRIQIWISILLGLGMALTHFLKYKKTDVSKWLKEQIVPFGLAVLIALGLGFYQKINQWEVAALLFAAVYALVANLFFLLKRKLALIKMGGNLAHLGFALMLVGIIFSSFNKHVISRNKINADLGIKGDTDEETRKENQENLLLFRNTAADMDPYTLTYLGDSTDEPNHYYKVKYTKRNKTTNALEEEFILYPFAQINPKMGLISSPDNKKYWDKDVFTYISKTTLQYTTRKVKPNDTIYFSNGMLVYKGISKQITNKAYKTNKGDAAVVQAQLDAYDINGKTGELHPVFADNGNQVVNTDDTLKDINLYVSLKQLILEEPGTVEIAFKQPAAEQDYIVMKAMVFPHINLLGLGVIIMSLGTFLAFFKRLTQTK